MVVASVHSRFSQSKEKMTRRLVKAMEKEDVDIIGNPTGRKINQKKSVQLDMEAIFEASNRTGTFLEINSFPERLDLDDANAKAAIEAGCKLAINTDAHNKEHISVARRLG